MGISLTQCGAIQFFSLCFHHHVSLRVLLAGREFLFCTLVSPGLSAMHVNNKFVLYSYNSLYNTSKQTSTLHVFEKNYFQSSFLYKFTYKLNSLLRTRQNVVFRTLQMSQCVGFFGTIQFFLLSVLFGKMTFWGRKLIYF